MFGQLFSTDVKIVFIIILILLLLLYVLSIVWVIRDAYARGAKYKFWGIIALIPFVGVIAYILLRPQLLLIDRDEQELEIAVKQRTLLKYGECSRCGYPVQNDYLVCPNCQQQLKTECRNCHRALDFKWKACPWCGAAKLGAVNNSNVNYSVGGNNSFASANDEKPKNITNKSESSNNTK